jgi:hypothetical protein
LPAHLILRDARHPRHSKHREGAVAREEKHLADARHVDRRGYGERAEKRHGGCRDGCALSGRHLEVKAFTLT